MNSKSGVYAVMRRSKDRKVAAHGEMAVIAAKFDECCDGMHRFLDFSKNLKQNRPEIDLDFAEQLYASLRAWGQNIGASSQALDRRLRFNAALRIETLEIDGASDGADAVGADEDVDIDPADSSQPCTNTDMFSGIEECLDCADEILEQLNSLGPELRKAYPEDLDRKHGSCNSSASGDTNELSLREHIEMTKAMFPGASPILMDRLGRASWKRRLSLKVLREKKAVVMAGRDKVPKFGPKRAPRRDVAVDAFNFQQPALKNGSDHTPPSIPRIEETFDSSSKLEGYESDDSRPSPSAVSVSKPPSVFSRPQVSRAVSSTSFATSAPRMSKKTFESVEIGSPGLTVPSPPKPLNGLPFPCPYCGFQVNIDMEVSTIEEWEEHVYEDLFTYLCTFDKCDWARQTYGSRDEWHQHELRNHLIPRVWNCGFCGDAREFKTRTELESHLLMSHFDDFSPTEASRMVSLLRPVHSHSTLSREKCPLCPSPLDSKEIKGHIAEHLEQLALTSVYGEGSTEDDDSDELMSQAASDNMSDQGVKMRFLQAFADEQVTNLGQHPRHAEITDQNDFKDDSDDEGSSQSPARASGTGMAARNWRVQKLMTTGIEPGQQHDMVQRRSRSDTDSTTRFPVLETRTFPKDDSFKGREKELANLYKILSEPGRVFVLSAEGGMGKTALAIEFTYRYEQSFEYIFWVQAETPVGASETFNQIALSLCLVEPGTDQEKLTKVGREFLESTRKKWLLVFDNVDRWDHIDAFTPMKTSATTGSILITTRHQALTAPSRPINYYRKTLEELTVEEGRELLLHGLPQELQPETRSLRDPEFKAAGDLASLAGLPLIIVLITGYMKAMNCKPSEFSSYWDSWWLDNNPESKAEDMKTAKGKLESIMKISVNDLSSDANKILRIMAFLDSDGVQKDLLVLDKGPKTPNYLQSWRVNAILRELVSKHFITEQNLNGKQKYIVHRAIQARILRELHRKSHQSVELFKLTVQLVRRRLPRPSLETPEPHKWSQFKEYLPHVATLQRIYSDQNTVVTLTPFLELAELFKDGGVLLWQRFLRNDAMRLLTAAEKILDQLETSHEDLRAEIHVTMNLLLQYLGISRRKEIKDRSLKVLEFHKKRAAQAGESEQLTDTDRIGLINAHADYANSLLQSNDFRAAEPIYQHCHEKLLKITSEEEDPFSFAKFAHHLAYCSMYRRDFAQAISLAEKAIGLMEQFKDSLLVLRFQFDLACIMLQSNDVAGALDLHERILADRMRLQGKDSYFTLQSQYAVGAIYSYMKRWDEAEWQIKNALQKAEGKPGKSVWSDAAVARSKFHLSQIMTARQDGRPSEEAENLAREGKDVLSRLLVYDDIPGVKEEDTGALFDHLQPVFGGRWTGRSLLKYMP
ncbi:hypothetical protein CPLU01_12846 [Colletotrichum plurivorum]|uniref:C2H2-type domain-containing protein n=1 Tax=Colletotrichum plurivorum TaxID=2175906 RepID=A0A8H6JWS0_9PEZI|nr:hypothetical protein CPLU01_12846 [Colletotrichum plurivorum]